MSDLTTTQARFDAAKDKLVASTPVVPSDLRGFINAIGSAKFATLMPTDESKLASESHIDNVGQLIELTSNYLADYQPNSSDVTKDNAVQLIANEVTALNAEHSVIYSTRNQAATMELLGYGKEQTKTTAMLSLLRQQSLFDVSSVEKMPKLVDFLKNDTAVGDATLAEWGVALMSRHKQDLAALDPELNRGSMVNMASRKTFDSIIEHSKGNAALCAMMYENLGDPFTYPLYEHAIKDDNASYAMGILTHSKFGLLTNGKEGITADPQVKQLMQVLVKSDESVEHLSRLIETSKTPQSVSVMLESLIEAHNNSYNNQALSTLIDKVGGNLTKEQLNRIGELLVKNSQTQPVLPALQSVIDAAKAQDLPVSHLEDASSRIREELSDDIKGIKSPLSHYSTTTIDFTGVNKSVALRDAKSAPHLRMLLDAAISGYDGDITFKLNSSDSLLDRTANTALESYLYKNDSRSLNAIITKPIKSMEWDSLDARQQVLFEANKHNKQLPDIKLNDVDVLADIVDLDAAIYSNGKKLMALDQLRSSDDFLSEIQGIDSGSITIDDTGLGKAYDKTLLSSLKDTARKPEDTKVQSKLNSLVGLPVNTLSSKMENSEKKDNISGNIDKNNVVKSVVDAAKAAIPNILRRPE